MYQEAIKGLNCTLRNGNEYLAGNALRLVGINCTLRNGNEE